jgi:hypothetical protein
MEDERAMSNELMKSAEQRPSSMGESAALSIAASRGHTTQFEQARPGGKQMEDVQREERDAGMRRCRKFGSKRRCCTIFRGYCLQPIVSSYVWVNWVQLVRLASASGAQD